MQCVTVTPPAFTDAEACEAALRIITVKPGSYTSEIAKALRLPMRKAFAVTDALIAEGKIEVAEE